DGRAVVRRAIAAGLLPLPEDETAIDHGKVGRDVELEAVPDVGPGREMEAVGLGQFRALSDALGLVAGPERDLQDVPIQPRRVTDGPEPVGLDPLELPTG